MRKLNMLDARTAIIIVKSKTWNDFLKRKCDFFEKGARAAFFVLSSIFALIISKNMEAWWEVSWAIGGLLGIGNAYRIALDSFISLQKIMDFPAVEEATQEQYAIAFLRAHRLYVGYFGMGMLSAMIFVMMKTQMLRITDMVVFGGAVAAVVYLLFEASIRWGIPYNKLKSITLICEQHESKPEQRE